MNAIVYHIFCVNDYLNIVKNQINRVLKSGLYDWCDIFEVICIDVFENFIGIDDVFKNLNKVHITKSTKNQFEYYAMKKIWELSQNNIGKIFYFHTKGVSNIYDNFKTKNVSEWKIKGESTWRDMLEYFLIDNYKLCIEKLEIYDSCGVVINNAGWYCGNFWWANLSFIKDNKEPGFHNRWYYEAWLNSNRKYKAFEFHHFNHDPFLTFLPKHLYYFDKDIMIYDPCYIKNCFYGTINMQIDEGRSIPIEENIVDVTDSVKNYIKKNNFNFVVNSKLLCNNDPSHGKKKYFIINFTLNNEDYRIVYEDHKQVNLSFLRIKPELSDKPRIIFLAHTSKKYDGHSIKIEDSSLTRKMSCMETWVPEVLKRGHEVIFFQGGSDKTYYDETNRVLHLPINDSYDYSPARTQPPKSFMLERLLAAIQWVLKNKDFDYVFRTDDGSYINVFLLDKIYDEIKGYDRFHCGYGGAGMFFSRKLCVDMVTLNYKPQNHIEDKAIGELLSKIPHKSKNGQSLLAWQYILGEKFFTIHYTNGKRMYFTDYTIKRYFNENNYNSRKIILNYPINSGVNTGYYPNTWYCTGGTTPNWYSYTTNYDNWEHYGKLIRSNFNVTLHNPFGINAISILVFYKTIFDINKALEVNVLLDYLNSINKTGKMIFFISEETESSKKMIEFLKSKSLDVEIKESASLQSIIDSIEIKPENGILIQIKKHE